MTRHHRIELAAAVALALLPLPTALAQTPPAFPGAEGYGGAFAGTAPAGGWFSTATVYHVTNLNDSGPGSLRAAFVENSANKVIVFDVGGTIQLTSGSLDIKNLSNYYVAGQTAPSPVTIYGDTTQITSSSGKTTQNVIVRHLAFRKGTGNGEDAITFAGGGLGTNLILDHVSASWAEDEVMSIANNNTNVTVQYSMINDALVGNHAYGSLIRPRMNSSVSFHHNLYAHNSSRQARFGTYDGLKLTADFRNNVIYNWRDRASYAGGSSEAEQEFVDVNYVGNYLIAGPGTIANVNRAFVVDKNVDVRAYQSGNFIDSDKQANPLGQPNGADTGWNMWGFNTPVTDQTLTQLDSPLVMAPVATQSAIDAYNQVINYVGNSWWNRDAIDARVINNVRTNTGPTIGAAAPPAAELNGVLSAPMVARPAGWDSDNDGMPNAWELSHGLNPNTANPGADFDSDGYSNVEEYLNEAGAFPAPRPISWNGTVGRYALNGNWDTWQPSRFDVVNVNAGKATVDAVGQHAGALNVAAAEVEVTAGWLDVASAVNVNSGGTLRLTGGSVAIGNALNLNSTGTMILGGGTVALNAAGQFNVNGGTLRTTVDQGIGMNANIGAAGATFDTTDKIITYSGSLTGAGGLTKLGTGTLTATQLKLGGPLQVGGGTLEIASNGGAAGTLETSQVTVASGARLRLNDNDLIVRYSGSSPEEAIRQLVRDGRAVGSTSGIFVTPGAAVDDRVLAVVDNTEWGKSTFNGISIGPNTIVGKYTYFGDANLDGMVSGDDYLAIDAGLGVGDGWLQGDFNMSGSVTGDDYLAIDANLGKGTSTPLAFAEMKVEMVALHAAMFGDNYLAKLADVEANGFETVPEPGMIALLALSLVGLVGRGRRRK